MSRAGILLLLACACAGARALEAQGTASVGGTVQARDGRAFGIAVHLTPTGGAAMPAPAIAARIDQRGLQFLPNAIIVSPGSTVGFPNSDPVLHNIFLVDERRTRTDLGTYPGGEFRELVLERTGSYLVMCHLHPEMVATVLVVDAPYRTIADSAGRFRFDGVAPGSYRLTTWHRRLKASDRVVTVRAGDSLDLQLVLTPGNGRAARTAGGPR